MDDKRGDKPDDAAVSKLRELARQLDNARKSASAELKSTTRDRAKRQRRNAEKTLKRR